MGREKFVCGESEEVECAGLTILGEGCVLWHSPWAGFGFGFGFGMGTAVSVFGRMPGASVGGALRRTFPAFLQQLGAWLTLALCELEVCHFVSVTQLCLPPAVGRKICLSCRTACCVEGFNPFGYKGFRWFFGFFLSPPLHPFRFSWNITTEWHLQKVFELRFEWSQWVFRIFKDLHICVLLYTK